LRDPTSTDGDYDSAASPTDYWRRNLTYVAVLLTIWFLVSYGAGILFVEQLNAIRIPGPGIVVTIRTTPARPSTSVKTETPPPARLLERPFRPPERSTKAPNRKKSARSEAHPY